MMAPPEDTQTLYFAYGSNLSLTQMSHRCPSSPYYGLGRLDKYKWIIGERGYANVVKHPSTPSSSSAPSAPTREERQVINGEEEYVIGMLYTLDAVDEERLDRAEGVPYAYTKHVLPIHILKPSPHIVHALVYVDEIRLGEGVCREEYVKRMNRGIRDAVAKGMEKGYVERVLRRFVREDEEVEEEVADPFLAKV